MNSPEIRIDCTDEAKFRVVEEVGRTLRAELPGPHDRRASGRGSAPAGGCVRASNTQPVLVLRFEAGTHEELETITGIFRRELARFPEVVWGEAEHG